MGDLSETGRVPAKEKKKSDVSLWIEMRMLHVSDLIVLQNDRRVAKMREAQFYICSQTPVIV